MSIMQKNVQDIRFSNESSSNNNVATYIALGDACAAKKQHQQALLHFIKAVLLAPLHIPALIGCSQALTKMNRRDEAAIYSERAFALRAQQTSVTHHQHEALH